jgi:hypothetical protein
MTIPSMPFAFRSWHDVCHAALLIYSLGSVVFIPLSVRAQTTEIENLSPTSAAEAFEKGQYQEALDIFSRLFEQRNKPEDLFNIAMCHKALFRYAEAIEYFEKFIAFAAHGPEAPIMQQARHALVDLYKLVGKIWLQGAPLGTLVEINGTPTRLMDGGFFFLQPGRYELTLRAAGFEPFSTHVNVLAEAENVVQAKMSPASTTSPKDLNTHELPPQPCTHSESVLHEPTLYKSPALWTGTMFGVGLGFGGFAAYNAVLRQYVDVQDSKNASVETHTYVSSNAKRHEICLAVGLAGAAVFITTGIVLSVLAHRKTTHRKMAHDKPSGAKYDVRH